MNIEYHFPTILAASDFIEAHLHQSITMEELADHACYSVFHFCRLFNQVVGITPYNYWMRRRLSEAAKDLLRDHRKVISVAFDYGFNSPEVFLRAFRKMFFCSPREFRRDSLSSSFMMPPLSQAYLHYLHRCLNRIPTWQDQFKLQLHGIMTTLHRPDDKRSIREELQSIILKQWDRPYIDLWSWEYPITSQKIYYYFGVASEQWNAPWAVAKSFFWPEAVRFQAKSEMNLSFTQTFFHHAWLPRTSYQAVDSPLALEKTRYHIVEKKWELYELYLPIASS